MMLKCISTAALIAISAFHAHAQEVEAEAKVSPRAAAGSWNLIIFAEAGYAGGSSAIDYDNRDACATAGEFVIAGSSRSLLRNEDDQYLGDRSAICSSKMTGESFIVAPTQE